MIWQSPHADVVVPEIPLTDYVLRSSKGFGDKPALIDGPSGRTISYKQLAGTITRLAAGLAHYGLQKTDVLAIYSPNLPEFALAFHAVALLGGITTMVPPLFTENEAATQIRDSGARFLLTIPQLLAKARVACEGTGVSRIFVIGEGDGAVPMTSLVHHDEKVPRIEIDPAEDLAALPYSSGTTGFPKGVMLTHRNLVSMLCQMSATGALIKDDTLVCVVPMYHLYGLHIVVNLALSSGSTVITLPRFDLNQFLSTLQKYKVTIAPLVPPIVLALSRAAEVDHYDLSKLRLIHCGAAPLSDEVGQACADRLGCEIRYGYGLTEVSPLSHASLPDRTTHRPGSVGFCLPNTECKVIDLESDGELGPLEPGEILIRGPQVMKGYLGNSCATMEMIDREGWLHSGDIGYADDEGRLFVVDRRKELIKYKGRQVAPAELEAILLSHPSVADASVVPSPDQEAGEVPKAFVVLRSETTPEAIMSFVAARVAPHKRIRRVEFIDQIPRTPAGKILRRVLAERERTAKT